MGMEKVGLKATLHFDKELRKNGSVELVEVAGQKPGQGPQLWPGRVLADDPTT
jgi:hypothetical protein